MPRSSDGSPGPASTRSTKRYHDHVIDAVVFDWDGTLMDDDASWRRCVAATADVPLFDDVIECLDALRGRFRLGVLTNGSTATHIPKVEASGLRDCFGSVTTTDVGAGKPLPAIFDHALATLDAAPSRSVYVGDSPARDVAGANGAGMTSVWINRTGARLAAGDPVADAEIVSLRELPGLLDRLST